MAEGQKNGIIGILIGGRDLEGKARYLRRISGGPVMAVKSADLRALHLTKHALAQRKALSVQKDNIIGLVVKTGDNSFSFKKKNRLWQQKKPFKSDKKGIIAEGIIWELDNLKWERILPADKKYGFEKPRYSITINNKHESSNDDSKNKNVVLLVGDIDPVSGLLAAKIKGQNKILGLKPAFLKKLP